MSETQWAWVQVTEDHYTFDHGNKFEFSANVRRAGNKWDWEINTDFNLASYGHEHSAALAMLACETRARTIAEFLYWHNREWNK